LSSLEEWVNKVAEQETEEKKKKKKKKGTKKRSKKAAQEGASVKSEGSGPSVILARKEEL
jgi:hypothetical protein